MLCRPHYLLVSIVRQLLRKSKLICFIGIYKRRHFLDSPFSLGSMYEPSQILSWYGKAPRKPTGREYATGKLYEHHLLGFSHHSATEKTIAGPNLPPQSS